MIDRIVRYYSEENSNVHRGVHYLSEVATAAYEGARTTVKRFINARSEKEIVFTRGTTEGINLVAQSWGRKNVKAGDEVLISAIEHHSNIVPWQILCEEKGAKLRIIPVNDAGELLIDEYARMLNERVKIVAFGHASNALGTINPIKRMIALAHANGSLAPHRRRAGRAAHDRRRAGSRLRLLRVLRAQGLRTDGHRRAVRQREAARRDAAVAGRRGHDPLRLVREDDVQRAAVQVRSGHAEHRRRRRPRRGARLRRAIGLENIAAHEHDLLLYATARLQEIDGLRIIGTAADKAAVISFVLEGVHPHDIGTVLDQDGIAIRTGHHCAQPLMMRFNVPATGRASFGLYNTREEADVLAEGLRRVVEVFR